jgi:nitroreductase
MIKKQIRSNTKKANIKNHRELNTLLQTIATRRSVRKFKKKQIVDADISTLIWAATMAPSGGNFQPWHYVVIKNEKLKDKLSTIILENVLQLEQKNLEVKDPHMRKALNHIKKYSTFFNNAPVVIAVLVKILSGRLFDLVMSCMETDKYETSILLDFVEVQSVAASIENLILVAHDMGYGSCWVRIPFCAKDALEKELQVKRPWYLIAFVPIGLPDEKPKFPKRKEVAEVMTMIE